MAVQSDAPVMIIVGALVAITGIASMYAVLNNFTGANIDTTPTDEEALQALKDELESQCKRLKEYNSVTTSTQDFRIEDGRMRLEDKTLIHEAEQTTEQEIECDSDIEWEAEEEVDEGEWTASISDSDGILAEVE